MGVSREREGGRVVGWGYKYSYTHLEYVYLHTFSTLILFPSKLCFLSMIIHSLSPLLISLMGPADIPLSSF